MNLCLPSPVFYGDRLHTLSALTFGPEFLELHLQHHMHHQRYFILAVNQQLDQLARISEVANFCLLLVCWHHTFRILVCKGRYMFCFVTGKI